MSVQSFILKEKEINAFQDRLKYYQLSWAEYIKKIKNPVYIHSFREKIKNFFFKNISNFECCNTTIKNKIPEDKKNIFFTYSNIKHNENKPFIMDSGSSNYESNVDLTLMNFKNKNIITKMISLLNKHSGLEFKFTKSNLQNLFDINFYIHSFLIPKGKKLVLMNCEDEKNTINQRFHSKFRFKNKIKNPYKHLNLDNLIKEKQNAIENNECKAIELSSIISYFAPDAYHSKGGFTHVLLEIQNNKKVNNSVYDYLNSCFDNIGFLRVYKHGNSIPQKQFNKYCARIVHALKRITELDKNKDIYKKCRNVVNYIDENSIHDNSSQFLRYSHGKHSRSKQIENKENINNFNKLIFKRPTKTFYIPFRILQVNANDFLKHIYYELIKIENLI